MNKLHQANLAHSPSNDVSISHEVLPPAAVNPANERASLDAHGLRDDRDELKPRARFASDSLLAKNGVGAALSDTPVPSLPSSPRM